MPAGPKPSPNRRPRWAGYRSTNTANFVANKLTARRPPVWSAARVNAQPYGAWAPLTEMQQYATDARDYANDAIEYANCESEQGVNAWNTFVGR